MTFNVSSLFHTIGHSIAAFFGNHQAVIETFISDAQMAAHAATTVATALGEDPAVLNKISQVSDGLNKIAGTVTKETTATTLSSHAENLTALVTGLVTSGDIGIKNEATKNAIGAAAVKVQGVVGALEIAALAAPTPTPAQ